MASIVFYISGHGFGHASRQIEVINALGPRLPAGVRLVVRTSAPRWLFDRTVKVPFTLLPGDCDTGMAQIDSLRLDEDTTIERAGAFYATFDARVEKEAAALGREEARLVLSDAPPLAPAAAAAAGVPSVVISNFTWDWIYESYADQFARTAAHVLPCIRQAYELASEGWRLPMGGGFAPVSAVRDLPFVARHATRSRADVLDVLDLDARRPIALASFGGYGIDDLEWTRLDCRDTWTILTTGRDEVAPPPAGIAHIDEARMYAAGLRYEDLVATADVVVTKPGYGIISECVANDTALLYTSRGRFAEYDVMVREMPRVLRCGFLSQDDLLAGHWRDALDALLAAPPPPERPLTNGAEVAAGWITSHVPRATCHVADGST